MSWRNGGTKARPRRGRGGRLRPAERRAGRGHRPGHHGPPRPGARARGHGRADALPHPGGLDTARTLRRAGSRCLELPAVPAVWAVHEGDDLAQAGEVSVRGVDFERRCRFRDPVERTMPPGAFSGVPRTSRVRVGVRETQRIVLPTLPDPLEGDVGVHRAVHDANLGQAPGAVPASGSRPGPERPPRPPWSPRLSAATPALRRRPAASARSTRHPGPARNLGWRAPSPP